MKLTMKRKGSFRANWRTADSKCGVGTELSPVYTYQCHIETADILDNNGFIYDQLQIDKYFQDKYKFAYNQYQRAQSCELIARNAVNDIKNMIESHMLMTSGMSVIYKIAVTISFGEAAEMTCEWLPEAAPKQVANVKKIKKPAKAKDNFKRSDSTSMGGNWSVDIETRSPAPLSRATVQNPTGTLDVEYIDPPAKRYGVFFYLSNRLTRSANIRGEFYSKQGAQEAIDQFGGEGISYIVREV